jgi:hypothetical protein
MNLAQRKVQPLDRPRAIWLERLHKASSSKAEETCHRHLSRIENDEHQQQSLKRIVADMLGIRVLGDLRVFYREEWPNVPFSDRCEYALIAWDLGYNLDMQECQSYL